jgi:hypothetical protein
MEAKGGGLDAGWRDVAVIPARRGVAVALRDEGHPPRPSIAVMTVRSLVALAAGFALAVLLAPR